jgi:phi13 family phage major tail protein
MPVQIGLNNLHYALLTADPVGGTAAYSAPVPIPGIIAGNINPNSSMETLFADDGPSETATALGQIELELNVKDLPLDVQAVLLGHDAPVNGILERKSDDVPPWVAIGFSSLQSNGGYRYVWLLKGKFGLPELSHQTKQEGIEFQTPTINGTFVKRDADKKWIRQADENLAGFIPAVATDWFTSPDADGSV